MNIRVLTASLLFCILMPLQCYGQTEQNMPERNNWGAKLRESNIHLGLDPVSYTHLTLPTT